MIHELFAVGSIWFWALVVLELGWLLYCVIQDNAFYRGIISLPVFVLILQCFTNANILLYCWEHPVSLALLLGLFLLGGCIWVFPRWYLFVTDHRRRYLDLRDKFLLSKGLAIGGGIPEHLKEEWDAYYKSNNYYGEQHVVFKPSPRDYRDRILTWMSLWPISLSWTALNYIGVRFFQTVYYHISGTLQRISDNVFKDEIQDFQKEPVVPPRPSPATEEVL